MDLLADSQIDREGEPAEEREEGLGGILELVVDDEKDPRRGDHGPEILLRRKLRFFRELEQAENKWVRVVERVGGGHLHVVQRVRENADPECEEHGALQEYGENLPVEEVVE